MYSWLGSGFLYVGIASRTRRHQQTSTGVICRWLEHYTFRNKRALPESHKLRYKLARRFRVASLSFFLVMVGSRLALASAERMAIKLAQPIANSERNTRRRSVANVTHPKNRLRRRPPKHLRSRVRKPTSCYDVINSRPLPGLPQDRNDNQCSIKLGSFAYHELYQLLCDHYAVTSGKYGPIDLFAPCHALLLALWASYGARPLSWRQLARRWGTDTPGLTLLHVSRQITNNTRRMAVRRRVSIWLSNQGLPGLTKSYIRVHPVCISRVQRLVRELIYGLHDFNAQEKRWILRQTVVTTGRAVLWADHRNASRMSKHLDPMDAQHWSADTWRKRMDGAGMVYVNRNWDIEERQSPEKMAATAAKEVEKWVRSCRINFKEFHWQSVGATTDIIHSTAMQKLQQKRRSTDREYVRYVKPMMHTPTEVIAQDDKNKKTSWIMPPETYLAALILYITTSEKWRFTSLCLVEAQSQIRTTLRTMIPNRLHGMLGLCSGQTWWLPHMYTTIKSKCYSGVPCRRVCVRFGHSCARKIVSYWQWPRKRAWRLLSRGMETIVKRFGGGWETWRLKNASSELRSKLNSLKPHRNCGCCARCGIQKFPYEAIVADAAQFYEEVDTVLAMKCAAEVIWKARGAMDSSTITVKRSVKRSAYIGGSVYSRAPGQVTFTLIEVYMCFAAAMSIGYCSVGPRVALMLGIPIGGLMSKVAASCVLACFEAKWRNSDESRWIQGFAPEHTPWDSLVASLRYVDDALFVSTWFCQACLEHAVSIIYPINFECTRCDRLVEWLDITFNLNTQEFGIKMKPACLPPIWASTFQTSRSYVLGRLARWRDIDLSDSNLIHAIATVIVGLNETGWSQREWRRLYFSTIGLASTREMQVLRLAMRHQFRRS